MESAAKRKAASAAAPESEGRPAKRQKVPTESGSTAETVASTQALGMKFLECLKTAKDKTGRPICTHFLTLPDKKSAKAYYDAIKLPIAIDTIEDKLNRGEYNSLVPVESDLKRLVNNAKAYNDKKSNIYEDAERLRKTASNWMVKFNPAYRIQGYQAVATPIPGEEPVPYGKPIPRIQPPTPKSTPPTPDTGERPRRAAAAAATATQAPTPAPSRLRHPAAAAQVADDDSPDFVGKTFQQAQEQIIRELIDYEEPESGLQIFLPFVHLPSRSLKDYYALIRDPVSLTGVQKKVRGVIGRAPPTGHTELKTWDDFEHMTRKIWKNARDYNEDGSDLYEVSVELEERFNKRLAEAKSKVEEPPHPKLKLNMSAAAPSPSLVPKQQLKLKLRQSPASESDTPQRNSATPGFIVDSEALQRQQKHVLESMNGSRSSQPPLSVKAQTPSISSNPFSGPPPTGSMTGSQMRAAGSPAAINGIKNDHRSPAPSSINMSSNAANAQRLNTPASTPLPSMPPPLGARTMSGSPLPNGVHGQHPGTYGQYHTPQTYYVPPVAPHFDHLRKSPLKNLNDALIPKITLNSHPALNLPKSWSVTIPASKTKTSYSSTINIAPTHSYLQITPFVPMALTPRLYRLFVTVNGQKTLEVNRIPVTAGINGNLPGASGSNPGTPSTPGLLEGGKKKGEPVYEAKLGPGVNRIEVEIVAERDPDNGGSGGKKKADGGKDTKEMVEVEKCTIFLHLARLV